MWSLIVALVVEGVVPGITPSEMKYTKLADVKTYQECRDMAVALKKKGLGAQMFCVEQQ